MTKHEIKDAILKSLSHFSKKGDQEIGGEIRPISDLGLDSEDGIAWAVELEQLGFKLPLNINPFVDDKLHRERNVEKIVDLLLKHLDQ